MDSMEDIIQVRRDSFPSHGSQKRRRIDSGEITECADIAQRLCPDGRGFIESFRNEITKRAAHLACEDVVKFSYQMYSHLQERVTIEIQEDLSRKDSKQVERYGELTTKVQVLQHELLVFLGKTSTEDLRVRNLENEVTALLGLEDRKKNEMNGMYHQLVTMGVQLRSEVSGEIAQSVRMEAERSRYETDTMKFQLENHFANWTRVQNEQSQNMRHEYEMENLKLREETERIKTVLESEKIRNENLKIREQQEREMASENLKRERYRKSRREIQNVSSQVLEIPNSYPILGSHQKRRMLPGPKRKSVV